MRVRTLLMAAVVTMSANSPATVLPVPGSFSTIQLGILAASPGDTVLVEPGVYQENINFLGKEITVAGRYLLSRDPVDIVATVIDGSSPAHPDTASCVLFVSGEGPGAVLEGFTLTGGTGTQWLDEHGAGVYREGGGILITLSSPTIRNNYIRENEALLAPAGTVSAGGGGVRVGDGSPLIEGNVILFNRAMYGGGVVLNYCSGAVLRNNIIAQNTVFQAVPGKPTFGGGGVWILERKPGDARANVLENNTIAGNLAFGVDLSSTAGRGGGLVVTAATVSVRNTIIWNNHQDRDGQVNGVPSVAYSCIEGGFEGTGNLASFPAFADSAFLLGNASPCIDAGDPNPQYDDPGSTDGALFPSRGTQRNDMGAYGGPSRVVPGAFSSPGFRAAVPEAGLDLGLRLPGEVVLAEIPVSNLGSAPLSLDSARVLANAGLMLELATPFPLVVPPAATAELTVRWSPDSPLLITDTLLIHHSGGSSPARVPLAGSSIPTALTTLQTTTLSLGTIDAAVARRDTTFFVVNQGTAADSIYVSIDPRSVTPLSALAALPQAALVPPRDSIRITFSIFPSQLIITGLGVYSPRVVVEPRFTAGATRFERAVNFRIIGSSGVDAPGWHPSQLGLGQNYPNPFNSTTTIEFTIPEAAPVDLTVFDLLGREVDRLVRAELGAGTYRVRWEAPASASGEYLLRLVAGGTTMVRRILLLR